MASQKDVAEHLDLTDRSVRDLQAQGILHRPAARRGYDLDVCRVAYIRHLRARAAGHLSEDGELDLTEERARLASEQADAQALKNATARGELIPRDVIQPLLERALGAFKSRFRGLPTRLRQIAPHLEREDIVRLQAFHDEVLTELAAEFAALAPEESEGEGGEG